MRPKIFIVYVAQIGILRLSNAAWRDKLGLRARDALIMLPKSRPPVKPEAIPRHPWKPLYTGSLARSKGQSGNRNLNALIKYPASPFQDQALQDSR